MNGSYGFVFFRGKRRGRWGRFIKEGKLRKEIGVEKGRESKDDAWLVIPCDFGLFMRKIAKMPMIT